MFSLFKKKPPTDLQEFSANFDMDAVRPFLERIAPLFEAGFGALQIEEVCGRAALLPHDQEYTLEFPIRHGGKSSLCRVRVFMDDADAPSVYLWVPAALQQQIQEAFTQFAEERGL
jgi:hypothetical protein